MRWYGKADWGLGREIENWQVAKWAAAASITQRRGCAPNDQEGDTR